MLSTYAVPDELPNSPAPSVANESTIEPLRGGCIGSPVRRPVRRLRTPMNVESESNRSVSITVIIAGTSDQRSAPEMSSFKNTDEKSGALNHCAGGATQPPTHAAAVTSAMPGEIGERVVAVG